MRESHTSLNQTNKALLEAVIGLIVALLIGGLVEHLIPDPSASDLHLTAVQEAQAVERALTCAENPKVGNVKMTLPPAARAPFLEVMGALNRLADLLPAAGRQRFYKCLPEATIARPAPVKAEKEITTRTGHAINRIDAILASYHELDDPPLSITGRLESLRSALVSIAYADGDLKLIRDVVSLVDYAVLALSLSYMYFTFRAMRRVLPDHGFDLFHLTFLLGVVVVVVGTVRAASRPAFIAAYPLLILMLLSVIYASLLPKRVDAAKYCRLLSFTRLLRWGGFAYLIVLFGISISYQLAELTVGAVPFRFAKLNAASLFFCLSLSILSIYLFRRRRTVLAGFCVLVGPLAFLIAILTYNLASVGYPRNILYHIVPDALSIRAPLIEIATARLMISLPLIAIILPRILVRKRHIEDIEAFLTDGSPNATVTLELLPRFPVELNRQGLLFRNADVCLDVREPAVIAPSPSAVPSSDRNGQRRRVGKALRNIFETARPVNVMMALVLVSISYCSTASHVELSSLAVLLVTTALAVSGSFIINDAADRAIDRINNPSRPVASGRFEPGVALTIGAAFLGAAPVIAVFSSLALGIFWLGASFLSAFYSFYLKSRSGLVANLLSASLTAALCFVGCCLTQSLGPMVAVSVSVFCAALAREIAKDVEDLPGDRLFRKHTLALQVGPVAATTTAIVFAGAQIAASYLPYLVGDAGRVYLLGITLANVFLVHALFRAYSASAARIVQRSGKISMVLYLIVYFVFVVPIIE